MKKIIGKIHLFLGLASGLIVFIIAITGCLYAFQAELSNALQPYRFVQEQDHAMLTPSSLQAIAERELPDKHIHAVLYAGREKAAQVIFFNFEPDFYYYLVFIDPYTGKLLRVKNMEHDFFYQVLQGHFYLWLPPSIGQSVAATATLIFVIMLITGIILWWPKNAKANKQRFTIRWNVRWRRRNYDLHNVLGFYVSWIALIFALTGLVWGFQWFAGGIYTLAGGGKSLIYEDPVSQSAVASEVSPVIDRVWYKMKTLYPDAEVLEVHIPETDSLAVAANANPDASTYYQTDYRYFDQSTLEELPVNHIYGRYPEASLADKLIRMNYDIHVGAILGLPGKILAFMASLLCASLPVTGFLIWYGRKKKKKHQNLPVRVRQRHDEPVDV